MNRLHMATIMATIKRASELFVWEEPRGLITDSNFGLEGVQPP